jgi:hypothetical protein
MTILLQPANSPDQGVRATSSLSLIVVLTGAVLLAVPLVNVFGPIAWLPPPMVLGLTLLFVLSIQGMLTFDTLSRGLLILCCICFLPWIYSAEFISTKTILHALAILVSVLVYYVALRSGLIRLIESQGSNRVLQILYVSLALTSGFILVEFIGANTGAWDVGALVQYIDVKDYAALVFGVIYRPRGFASEPGVMALLYDFALFAVLPFALSTWRRRLGYLMIIVPAYLLLFSTASLMGAGLGVLFLTAWNFLHRFISTSRRLVYVAVLAFLLVAGAGSQVREVSDALILTRVGALVTGSGDDYSAQDRRGRIEQAIKVVDAYPLGIGFGIAAGLDQVGGTYRGFEISSGQISLFATFLLSGGILGATLALGIMAWALVRTISIPGYGPTLAAGGIAVTAHHFVVTEFWLPFLWVFLAISSAMKVHSLRLSQSATAAA